MGVDNMGVGDVKAQLGNHIVLRHIKFKLHGTMMGDSVVIRGDSKDQGNFVIEVSDLQSNCNFRRGEGPENGTWCVVYVALTKGVAVDAKAILECFKVRHPRRKVAPVEYGIYRVAEKLLKLCVKCDITREDKIALEKGILWDLMEDAGPILDVSELVSVFSTHVSITRIQVLERPVDTKAKISANTEPPAKLLMHFLVVLTFKGGQSIVVEKVKELCRGRNVCISRHVGPRGTSPRTAIELTGVEVQVQELQDLIKECDTDYHMLKANCWDFASAFAKGLVKLLLNNAAADSADKDNLQDGLEKLGKSERPTPYGCLRLLALWVIFDGKNEATRKKWLNRIEAHVDNCQDCRFHNILGKLLKKRGDFMAFIRQGVVKQEQATSSFDTDSSLIDAEAGG